MKQREARADAWSKGRALLLFRLARHDIRHHVAQAVLLVVAIAAATAALTMAFALNSVNSNPYQQTMAATKGPDVVAQSGNDPYTGVTSPADLAALVALNHAKGVVAHSGPYPIVGDTGPVGPDMRSADIVTAVEVEGRPPGVAAVDQPKVTDGTWIRPGGVVVERSFAEAANLRLGQTITLNGRPFRVDGFAVTTAFGGFPGMSLMWATEAAARSLATKADPLSYISNLKLSDASPRAVAAFVNAHSKTQQQRHHPVPHPMDRDRLRGRQLPAQRPGRPADRRHAARPARAGERGRPRRGPPGGRHPAGRTVEGRRRHAGPGRGDLPCREPVPGARRGLRRPAGRLACGPALLQSRGRPRRYSGSAAAHARHGRRSPRRGARSWRSRRRSFPRSVRRG